jgi:hypothetical protein
MNFHPSLCFNIPYSKDTELLMDILRYGAGVKVIAPAGLVRRVSKEYRCNEAGVCIAVILVAIGIELLVFYKIVCLAVGFGFAYMISSRS